MVLGLGYAGVVLGLGRLLPKGSSLVVAAATLTVAAVFQPVRRRIQAAVDRRFNRRRHAARTIQAFSGRLRDEIDLDTLTGELLTVVEETMQPTHACVTVAAAASGAPDDARSWSCATTMGGGRVRLRSPPQAARTAGPPRSRPRR